MLSIAVLKEWWDKNANDAILGIGAFLLVLMAFLAGRLSSVSETTDPVIIEVPDTVLQKQAELQKINLVDLALPEADSKIDNSKRGIPEAERRGEYVASKNGAYYYTANMSGALRIKVENRIWFNTQEEAKARGLKPAKGLK
ncbi:MAG: hypothetical protein Q7S09_00505 [bacterium]|nr:hypothetical protein [bacterium]